MRKKSKTSEIPDGAVATAIAAEWLAPVSADAPCGPSLEYDTEYAVLQARLAPKADVQYGEFSAQPPAPDWVEVERDCRRLLLRSKDIPALIWFARSRTRLAGASGLLQGLAALTALLRQYPREIHPQLEIEGLHDPEVRANALAALCDPEGLLGDIRDVVVSSNTAFRLSVRDVERAFAIPRSAYAMDAETVKRQLRDLQAKADTTLTALLACARHAHELDAWARETLADDAPDLCPLTKLLSALAVDDAHASQTDAANEAPRVTELPSRAHSMPGHEDAGLIIDQPSGKAATTDVAARAEPSPVPVAALRSALTLAEQREQIRHSLIQVRAWIEHNEPSSPVAVLLKQAERMWGKRFSEVAGQIPPDLLQAWDQD